MHLFTGEKVQMNVLFNRWMDKWLEGLMGGYFLYAIFKTYLHDRIFEPGERDNSYRTKFFYSTKIGLFTKKKELEMLCHRV